MHFTREQVTFIPDHHQCVRCGRKTVEERPFLLRKIACLSHRGRVEDQQDNVGVGHSLMGFGDAEAFGLVGGVAQAGGVDEVDGDAIYCNVSVTRSRVVPGDAVTMARSRWTRRLKSEVLPALGRPTMARRKPSRTTRP